MTGGGVRSDIARRVVLVGAGHAHLHTLRRAGEFQRRGVELVVIAPEDFWYSGLATGVLGGVYPPELDRIDIAELLRGTGARLIRQSMSGLDLARRRVVLDDGSSVDFGALSLNLGSVVPHIPGANAATFSAKPVTRLMALRAALEEDFRRQPQSRIKVAVAGGGVTGCEIAANIADLARRRRAAVAVRVYAGGGVAPDLPAPAADRLAAQLRKAGVEFQLDARAERIAGSRLILTDETSAPFDYLVNATGLQPPPLTRTLGLPITDDGAIAVDDRLMAPGAEGVFAAGDCIAFDGRPLPRVGVYAIRQAPILFENLIAFLDGGELQSFTPQKRYLSIMTLGSRAGLAYRGATWWHGRSAFLLKDWIDRRFLRNHRPSNAGLPSLSEGADQSGRDRSASTKL